MELDLKNFRVTLSKKSFHYKYMKFLLGKLMPDLYALCPYFWLLVFCVLIGTFTILPFKLFVLGIETTMGFLDQKFFIPAWNKFMENVKLEDFYKGEGNKLKTPFCFKAPYGGDWYFEDYIRAKYNLTWDEYKEKVEKSRELYYAKLTEKNKKKLEAKQKRSDLWKSKYNKFLSFLPDVNFTINKLNINSIIKWTKRTVSVLFTVGLVVGIYFLCKYLSSLTGTMNWNSVLDSIIWLIKLILEVVIFLGLIVFIVIGVGLIYEKLNDNGKISAIGSFFSFIWKCLCFIGRIIASPFVFCYKYFKATKDDYCPEIVWEDDDTDSTK